MPEGPEIRRAADRVAAAVVGHPLVEVQFGLERLEPFENVLSSARVTAVDTHGKAMLTRFDNGLTVYSHNQLYGRWVVQRPGSLPKTGRQLRFAIKPAASDGAKWALLYSASEIEVVPNADVASIPFIARAGPDCLSPRLRPSSLAKRLDHSRFRRRSLAALLLDQGFVAGIGNYLRSEILFVAGVHPLDRPLDLDADARAGLGRAIRSVCRRAYQSGGVTTDAALVKALKAEGATRRGYRHYVFRRRGLPCHRCGTTVDEAQLAGRWASWCPSCQPRVG